MDKAGKEILAGEIRELLARADPEFAQGVGAATAARAIATRAALQGRGIGSGAGGDLQSSGVAFGDERVLYEPKEAYNKNQLDLFADPYDTLETRPGTTETQLDAGRDALAAVEKRIFSPSMRGRASVLGSAISKDYRDNGYISLVGQIITSSGDLALVTQVLRAPRFETFRTFYVKDGKIVGERADPFQLVRLP